MQTISRRKLANYIADQLVGGASASTVLQQAAAYLVEHKRVNQAELLIRDVEAILAREHGVVVAQVTSARELSAGLLTAIEQFVSAAEDAQQVEVSTSIDPSLLGGVVIRTPRAELDASVRKKLNLLKA